MDFVHGDAAAKEAAKEAEGFFDGELVGELRFLELDADALAQVGGMLTPVAGRGVRPSPASGNGQAFADFDGGGLACSVGAEQAEALAG